MAAAVTKGDIAFNVRTQGAEFASEGGFKLVLRMLPPLLKAGDFFNQIAPILPTDWMRSNYFVEGHYPTDTFKQPVYSRCYLEFDSLEHMRQFASEVRTTAFYNSQDPPNVETSTLTQDFIPVLEQSLHPNMAPPEESEILFNSPKVTEKFKKFQEMLENPTKFEKPPEVSAEEMFFKPILNIPKAAQKKEAAAKEVKPIDKDAEKKEAKLKRKKERREKNKEEKKKEEKQKKKEKEKEKQKPKLLKRPQEATPDTQSEKKDSLPEVGQRKTSEAKPKKESNTKPKKEGPEKKHARPKKESRESTPKPSKEEKPKKPKKEKPKENSPGDKPKPKPRKPRVPKEASATNSTNSQTPKTESMPKPKAEKKPRAKKPKKPAE